MKRDVLQAIAEQGVWSRLTEHQTTDKLEKELAIM
jgi:hypothetical protein